MFKEIFKRTDCQIPQQSTEQPKEISTYSIPVDEALRINAQYQQEIARLDEEDMQAFSMMDEIYTS